MKHLNNIKENMNSISDIEYIIRNRKLKTEELEYLLKTVQSLKNKKVRRLETFKNQRTRHFSRDKNIQPPTVKKNYNLWNKSRPYEKNRNARRKERNHKKLKKHYQVLRHVKPQYLNPNRQNEMKVYPELNQNLKERDTFSEKRVTSTGSTRITLHQGYESTETTTKKIHGELKDSFKTTTKTTEDDYSALFSDLRKDKFHPTNNRIYGNSSFILFVSMAVVLSLLLMFVLFRCSRKKSYSQSSPKNRKKKEYQNAKYTLLEDKQQKCSVNLFDEVLSNEKHNFHDIESGSDEKNAKMNAVDAIQMTKPKEFATPKSMKDLDNKIKESPLFIFNNKVDGFKFLSHSKNNPNDKYSLRTDETVSCLDISLPSIQHENTKHSSNSKFLKGASLKNDSSEVISRNLVTVSSSPDLLQSVIETNPSVMKEAKLPNLEDGIWRNLRPCFEKNKKQKSPNSSMIVNDNFSDFESSADERRRKEIYCKNNRTDKPSLPFSIETSSHSSVVNISDSESDSGDSYSSALYSLHSNSNEFADKETSNLAPRKIKIISAPKYITR